MALENLILTNLDLNKEKIKKWFSYLPLLIETRKGPYEISPAACEEFKFDLHGLLKYSLGVSDDLIYPTMLVNGYNSSHSYIGKENKFYTLDSKIAANCLTMVKKIY